MGEPLPVHKKPVFAASLVFRQLDAERGLLEFVDPQLETEKLLLSATYGLPSLSGSLICLMPQGRLSARSIQFQPDVKGHHLFAPLEQVSLQSLLWQCQSGGYFVAMGPSTPHAEPLLKEMRSVDSIVSINAGGLFSEPAKRYARFYQTQLSWRAEENPIARYVVEGKRGRFRPLRVEALTSRKQRQYLDRLSQTKPNNVTFANPDFAWGASKSAGWVVTRAAATPTPQAANNIFGCEFVLDELWGLETAGRLLDAVEQELLRPAKIDWSDLKSVVMSSPVATFDFLLSRYLCGRAANLENRIEAPSTFYGWQPVSDYFFFLASPRTPSLLLCLDRFPVVEVGLRLN